MELAHFLVVKNYSLLPTFQDLYTAFVLFLTLPVTVATAERSFSKSKLIKTYLRNTVQDDGLSQRFSNVFYHGPLFFSGIVGGPPHLLQ